MIRAICGVLTALCVAVLLAALSTTVRTSGGETIKISDACDPATFNAGIAPGTCVGDGDVTLAAFSAEFGATGQVEDWEFDPSSEHVDAGDAIRAENEGGETHTFTQVAAFGGGIVQQLNKFAGDRRQECLALGPTDFVPPGGRSASKTLPAGTYKFQCCIHPWMHATITVGDRR